MKNTLKKLALEMRFRYYYVMFVITKKENRTEFSQYARFFDESCTGWTKDAEYNLLFLKQQQANATSLLEKKGFLFLNEVYEMLGIPFSKEGQLVGWIYNKDNPIGDNYVDFGLYDISRNRGFVNGFERSVLLDFNVDGMIFDKL